MLIDTENSTRPAFFLLGTRVPPGDWMSDGSGERVAAVVLRDVLGLDGVVRGATDVLLEDQPLNAAWGAGPFRYESEIAAYKPAPDVVVLDTLDFMSGAPPATADDAQTGIDNHNFGTVAIDRGGGFGPELPLPFGWRSRLRTPRLEMAGDAEHFHPTPPQVLPVGFRNSFFNGHALAAQALFAAGDRLRFTDIANVQRSVRIPVAPVLRVTDTDGLPVPMVPRADTVIFDRVAATFTIVWRAVLPWQARLAAATLVVQ